MLSVEEKFEEIKKTRSDINQHILTIYDYA